MSVGLKKPSVRDKPPKPPVVSPRIPGERFSVDHFLGNTFFSPAYKNDLFHKTFLYHSGNNFKFTAVTHSREYYSTPVDYKQNTSENRKIKHFFFFDLLI